MSKDQAEKSFIHGFPADLYDFFFKERGDRRLEHFFRRHGASEHDAEDLVQEVILTAVRSYETKRDDSSIQPWIWAIAGNKLNESLRSRSHVGVSVDPGDATNLLDRLFLDQSEEERALLKEREKQIQAAFTRFANDKPDAAKVLLLFLNEEMTIAELAGVLGRTTGGTREYISNVRRTFGAYLREALHVK